MTPLRTVLAIAVVALAIGLGVAGYFIGRATGEDLTAAADRGARAGRAEGAADGTRRGYREGFQSGRKDGYERAYPSSYRTAYRAAFEDASLEPPEQVEVPGK
jgi:hypothetical protein